MSTALVGGGEVVMSKGCVRVSILDVVIRGQRSGKHAYSEKKEKTPRSSLYSAHLESCYPAGSCVRSWSFVCHTACPSFEAVHTLSDGAGFWSLLGSCTKLLLSPDPSAQSSLFMSAEPDAIRSNPRSPRISAFSQFFLCCILIRDAPGVLRAGGGRDLCLLWKSRVASRRKIFG
ncbi:hypothetical protein BKA93DRAFT_796106 [Sparassis latifolia]